MHPQQPNLVFIFADQLRAASLPAYGEHQISTPAIDRLVAEGMTADNFISGCPVCTPARAMLLTGRHPQTTGHIMNSVKTRHSELSVADALGKAGYRTGWVGKWHLHTGIWPALNGLPMQPDYIPPGRDRLGFEYWRAYNQHMVYFDGYVHMDDYDYAQWDGYETDGLFRYGQEFIDAEDQRPFALFLSPHQPHWTPGEFAPEQYYEGLPEVLEFPPNVPESSLSDAREMYRHYLAMIRALDDMVANVLRHLEEVGQLDNTLVILAADHGTQVGAQGEWSWAKQLPYESSINVPLILRHPGHIPAGERTGALISMVDVMPTLCGLLNVPVPRSAEGKDLSAALTGDAEDGKDEILLMNFSATYDALESGQEWRGVRTRTKTYARWLNGKVVLYDLATDPLQMVNLAGLPEHADLEQEMSDRLDGLMRQRGDALVPVTQWLDWFDPQRRVIRNCHGALSHPEAEPDWSLLS